MNNTGYYLKEATTMFKVNKVSKVFSLLSVGLIFFILGMVISGWWASTQVVDLIKGEAEINLYFTDNTDLNSNKLKEDIENVTGVTEVSIVSEDEAYKRMEEILGKEAAVLEFFDDNPFSPFVEVDIHIEEIDHVINELSLIEGIDHIRDNRDILERLSSIEEVLRYMGYSAIVAVGVSTLVIISHIIKLGIYNNREQIETLRLLGAPEYFIAWPFLLEGLLLTLGGGIFAVVLITIILNQAYSYTSSILPFIPLPVKDTLLQSLIILIMVLSTTMGIIGSLLGLSSEKSN